MGQTDDILPLGLRKLSPEQLAEVLAAARTIFNAIPAGGALEFEFLIHGRHLSDQTASLLVCRPLHKQKATVKLASAY